MRLAVFVTALAVLAATAGSAQASNDQETPPGLEFAFQETVSLGKVVEVGKTVRGERRIIRSPAGTSKGRRSRAS